MNIIHRQKVRALSLTCLLALFAQLTLAIPHLSATYDEPIYTGIGYADWTTGDFGWHGIIGHGPLVNLIATWPLLLGGERPDVTTLPSWRSDDSLGLGREVLAQLGALKTTLFLTRFPITWLTLLLAAVIFRWAKEMQGKGIGLMALALFAFEPNIIAHGQLHTTDMGVTLFGFAGTYLLSRYLQRRTEAAYIGTGVALGAAIASKTSGLFWLGSYSLIIFLYWLASDRRPVTHRLERLLQWGIRLGGITLIGLVTLWAAYGLEFGPLPNGKIPLPAPSHWAGMAYQRANLTEGQTTFIAGKLYEGGRWFYFPLTLALKTPLPLLLAGIAGLIVIARQGLGPMEDTLPFAVTPIAYWGVSMLTGLNIGHRHLLPLLPYIAILAAQAARGRLPRRVMQVLSVLMLLWYMGGTIAIFPHYLTSFNMLAGGAEGGYRYLADSNVDWGQGFFELRAFLDADSDHSKDAAPIRLAAFSSIDPAWYGIPFEPLPPTTGAPPMLASRFAPPPGRYVLSVVPLQGIWLLDPDTYDWFRHREPTARIGHVFNVYDVHDTPPTRNRVIQCAGAAGPLNPAALEEGLGRHFTAKTDQSSFNCHGGWLYPNTYSWLIIPPANPDATWFKARLAGMPLVFSQREHWHHPALEVYAPEIWPEGARPTDTSLHLMPDGTTPSENLEEGDATESPIASTGPLICLGYALGSGTAGVTLDTFWQVTATTDRPLSLMAHLVDGLGRNIAVADGLSIPLGSWRPGDRLVQHHTFEIVNGEAPTGSLYVLIGAYWLDTMERWAFAGPTGSQGTTLLVPKTLDVAPQH